MKDRQNTREERRTTSWKNGPKQRLKEAKNSSSSPMSRSRGAASLMPRTRHSGGPGRRRRPPLLSAEREVQVKQHQQLTANRIIMAYQMQRLIIKKCQICKSIQTHLCQKEMRPVHNRIPIPIHKLREKPLTKKINKIENHQQVKIWNKKRLAARAHCHSWQHQWLQKVKFPTEEKYMALVGHQRINWLHCSNRFKGDFTAEEVKARLLIIDKRQL